MSPEGAPESEGGSVRNAVRMVLRVAGAGVILYGMFGCASSPPMHYYTLSSVPAAARVTVPADTVPLRLDRVTIPGELDRLELVRKVDATRVQIAEQDRWAAPLDEMIRRVLSEDLGSLFPPQLVVSPNEPSVGDRRQSVAVDIQEFYADAACAVTLRGSWTVRSPDNKHNSQGAASVQTPASGGCSGSAGIPAAMNQALSQFADQMAHALAAGGLAGGPGGAVGGAPGGTAPGGAGSGIPGGTAPGTGRRDANAIHETH